MARSKWIYGGGAALLAGLIVWAVTSVPEIPEQTDAPQGPRIMSYADNTLSEERDGRTVWKMRPTRTLLPPCAPRAQRGFRGGIAEDKEITLVIRAGGHTALARGAHGGNKVLVGLIFQQVEVEIRSLACPVLEGEGQGL